MPARARSTGDTRAELPGTPSAAKCSGRRRPRCASPFPYVPESLGMQGAIFVDAGSLWAARAALPLDAVADEGDVAIHPRQRPGAPVDRISASSGNRRSVRCAPISPKPCSRPISTRPKFSALALRRTSKARKFAAYGIAPWLMPRRFPVSKEFEWNIQGFFERAGPFALGSCRRGRGRQAGRGARSRHRHRGCEAAWTAPGRATSPSSTIRNISRCSPRRRPQPAWSRPNSSKKRPDGPRA